MSSWDGAPRAPSASGLDLLEQSEARDRALDALMESFRWLSRALAVEETPETG